MRCFTREQTNVYASATAAHFVESAKEARPRGQDTHAREDPACQNRDDRKILRMERRCGLGWHWCDCSIRGFDTVVDCFQPADRTWFSTSGKGSVPGHVSRLWRDRSACNHHWRDFALKCYQSFFSREPHP